MLLNANRIWIGGGRIRAMLLNLRSILSRLYRLSRIELYLTESGCFFNDLSRERNMLNDVLLSFWPSALNSFAWSQDHHLALAAGEHVQLMVTPASVQFESI